MKLSIVSVMFCLCAAPASAWTFSCGPDPNDPGHYVNVFGSSSTPPDRVCTASLTLQQVGSDNSTYYDTQTYSGLSLPNGAVNQLLVAASSRNPGMRIVAVPSCNVTCDPP
jgi:hypothetical protein